ncbi:MAG: YceI family protein [Rhodospirillaceae bacterium]|nr:YceI family protein [Rhodospirillaceae bacterium]MBT5665331.1 YceI family protein [Rhodospirillaceae bacterium]MBT5808945.1 YceI family protein [Rhodospirillaceae bacterium]
MRHLFMRNSILGILTLVTLGVFATGRAYAESMEYTIDPSHLTVAFKVHHVGYFNMVGLFAAGSGAFSFDEDTATLSDLKVVVETKSVFTGHKKRDAHLRSADFLNASEFPEMVFVGKTTEKTGERTGKVHGELTLLGVTRPITLDVRWNKSADHPIYKRWTLGIDASGVLKRSDFGMAYAVKNGWIGDEIKLMIGFEAYRE